MNAGKSLPAFGAAGALFVLHDLDGATFLAHIVDRTVTGSRITP